MKKSKTPKNVLNIADSPKFRETKQVCVSSKDKGKNREVIEVASNRFGFAAGDWLICKTEFDTNEIQKDTLVLIETPSGYSITNNVSDTTSVYAIVEGFQRDL